MEHIINIMMNGAAIFVVMIGILATVLGLVFGLIELAEKYPWLSVAYFFLLIYGVCCWLAAIKP